jgi:hypothetical protein
MIKDLILIGCIIIASFIFKISTPPVKNNNLFDPQMMFILLCLAIIIIHKIFYIKKFNKVNLSNKEGFQSGDSGASDLANELLNFTSGQQQDNVDSQVSSMSEAARNEYITQIRGLNDQVSSLNETLREAQGLQSVDVDDSNTNQRLDLESMQQMQDNQIKFLEDKIEMAKNLLAQQQIMDNAKKYQPIKVFSSCAVSSADGTFNEDTFINTNSSTSNNNSSNSNSTSNSNNSSTDRIRTTVSQQSGNNNVLATQVSNFLNTLTDNGTIEIH